MQSVFRESVVLQTDNGPNGSHSRAVPVKSVAGTGGSDIAGIIPMSGLHSRQ